MVGRDGCRNYIPNVKLQAKWEGYGLVGVKKKEKTEEVSYFKFARIFKNIYYLIYDKFRIG